MSVDDFVKIEILESVTIRWDVWLCTLKLAGTKTHTYMHTFGNVYQNVGTLREISPNMGIFPL